MKRNVRNRIQRKIFLIFTDVVLLAVSCLIASWIALRAFEPVVVPVTSLVALALILSLSLVRFYDIRISEGSLDLVHRGLAGFAPTSLVVLLAALILEDVYTLWIPYFFVFFGCSFLLMMGSRFFYRSIRYFVFKQLHNHNPRTVIYGAGELGMTLTRQYQKGKLPYHISAFVDDNQQLTGTYLLGIKVWGTVDDLKDALEQVHAEVLIIAISHIDQERMLKAVDAASEMGCTIKVIPSLFEMQQGAKELDLRNLDYADLLGRSLISIDKEPIMAMVRRKRVLITGAGGSIGSEICKQLLTYAPEQLILLDIDETELHDLSLRLHNFQKEWSEMVVPVVCDVKNRKKIDQIIEKYKPQLIFHAAAYKHVPLQELYPEEAITTNIGGSFNVLRSARDHQVPKVVVISTDKAVNPTNVMGATKRVVELMARMFTNETTEIVCVRFGNVLGSRGSMLPLFMDQIKAGVPITVTHKDIIRYFMAIPEAVSLVFKAASMAKGGEVMVLDMGQPVKIYDFAQKLVKYYGDGRSQVIVTGLRPGEKLYEELLADKDTTIPTDDPLVLKAKLLNDEIEENSFKQNVIDQLETSTKEELVAKLKELVPCFTSQQ